MQAPYWHLYRIFWLSVPIADTGKISTSAADISAVPIIGIPLYCTLSYINIMVNHWTKFKQKDHMLILQYKSKWATKMPYQIYT